MKAAVMRNSQLFVEEMESPKPAAGEVLVKTLSCGICGSDLHALKHTHEFAALANESGGALKFEEGSEMVMGHEFCAEVLDYGPDTQKILKPGARVCSMPLLLRPGRIQSVGYSQQAPGGYGEQMLLSEALLLPVPDSVPTEMAALTEPMAVGYHAVQMAGISTDEVPLIIGCGPVGLAVLSALKMKQIGPIIAADFSPSRRKAAERLGADIVVDPSEMSPYDSWADVASKDKAGEAIPVDPLSGSLQYRKGVFFECVGVPGVIDQMMRGAQRGSRMVVVGVCMEEDHFQPFRGITKELNLQFVLGYSAEEFTDTLRFIGDGRLNIDGLVTSKIGVDDVPEAFERLAQPDSEIKILVEPWR